MNIYSTTPLHKVNSFFESYAQALSNFDTKGMAFHYEIPCTIISDDSAKIFNDSAKLEGLFNQATLFYKQFGIAHARPEVWSKRMWSKRIVKAKVNWQYFDEQNKPVYNCDYHYILRLDKNDKWKINVAVSVNEKEQSEAWLQQNKETVK